jgi:hypothetical protein
MQAGGILDLIFRSRDKLRMQPQDHGGNRGGILPGRPIDDLLESGEGVPKTSAVNPRESLAHYLLGIVRMRAGDSVGARVALTRYLELAPSRFTDQIVDAQARLRALP